MFSNDALADETALVTGATGGIGQATAETLADMGAEVAVTGRDRKRLSALETDIEGKVYAEEADLTSEADRNRLIEEVCEALGSPSLLVNAAGVGGGRESVVDLTREQLERVMEVNYTATVLLTRSVYRKMRTLDRGAIVFVSSLSGLRGTAFNAPYVASKFAITGFTQSLALEAIEHGVRVNAVCPGWVDTELARELIRRKADVEGRPLEEQLERERESIPSGRFTSPDEVANAVAFLLTDAAANVVGESFKLSGGAVLR